MKKIAAFLMSVLLVFSLSACSTAGQNDTNTEDQQTKNTSTVSDDNGSSAASTDAADKKTLVVYFSATGSTERVAETIADATGGELFKLEPTKPYTDGDLNWRDSGSRVSREHDNESERTVELVSSTTDSFKDASVVYVGYPIWWGIAAWPVNEFIKNNDFTGKTVIPFCTSSSSGLGDSAKQLREMAGSGAWLDGQRFSSSVSEQTVRDWVDSLVTE